MTWLVFGVSCLLVLAGAVAITFGAPIIQLERGWAEVIAGSVAVSSGGVVFALGVVLMRLEALRDALAETAPSGVGFAVRDVPLETLAAIAETERFAEAPNASAGPTTPSTPPPEPEAAPPVIDETREFSSDQVLWKRIRRPADVRDVPLASASLSPAPAEMSVREQTSPKPDAVEEARSEPRPVAATPMARAKAAAALPEASDPAEDDTAQLGWLERSLIRGRPSRSGADEAPDPAASGERVEPSLGGLTGEPAASRSTSAAVSSSAPEAVEAGGVSPHPEAAPADDGPIVIGRYQAGVASYIMYSDGTIEVETEGGQSHRFGSMDELKAFIANQDKADA